MVNDGRDVASIVETRHPKVISGRDLTSKLVVNNDTFELQKIRGDISGLEIAVANGNIGTGAGRDILRGLFGYDLAVARANHVRNDENSPRLLLNDDADHAVVLVHGIRSSPYQLMEHARYLHERGYTVYVVRLNGHGISHDRLKESTRQQWMDSIAYVYYALSQYYSKVSVMGVSMGGLLPIPLICEGMDFKGLVTMGSPIKVTPKLEAYSLLCELHRFGLGRWLLERTGFEYVFPGILQDHDREGYDVLLPTRSVDELTRLRKETRSLLPGITLPLLVLQAERDDRVPVSSARQIYRRAGSARKDLVIYPGESQHVLPVSDKRREVFERTYAFLQSIDKSA